MRRLTKILVATVALLLILAGCGAAWAWSELQANGRRIRDAYAAGLSRSRQPFLADQALARTHPILATAGRTRDAGPALNPRIHWDGAAPEAAPRLEQSAQRPLQLALDPTLVARIPKAWWTTPPEVWEGLDFSWLAELASFDHWDVESNSPWADAPGAWPAGFPHLFELMPWVKLRLAKGVHQGRLDAAVAEVEHLAALILSTESILGMVQGLQVLGLEDQALASLEAAGRPAPKTPNRKDQATWRRAWRATMAARAYLLAEAPARYRGEVELIAVGRCAAANEALRSALALAGLGHPERDGPAHWLQADDPALAGCRLAQVRRGGATGARGAPDAGELACGEVPQPLRRACRTLMAVPLLANAERSLALEVFTQMELANASTDALYGNE